MTGFRAASRQTSAAFKIKAMHQARGTIQLLDTEAKFAEKIEERIEQKTEEKAEEKTEEPVPDLSLVIASEPRIRVFLQNLRDLFRRRSSGPLRLESEPGDFWPDVFVERRLPWRSLSQSAGYHIVVIALLWAGSRFLAVQHHAMPRSTFNHADLIYYSPSEYLPPLDTRSRGVRRAAKAEPEYSAQAIISLPPEADNHSQTIVAPPKVKLQHEVALPNTVLLDKVLLEKMPADPRLPVGPAPTIQAAEISRLTPQMQRAVVAPPPDIRVDPGAQSQKALPTPQPDVIAPPPVLESTSTRPVADLNVGHSSVIAPAPQLPLAEQRTFRGRSPTALSRQEPRVISPPPSLAASGGSRSAQGLIALNLHPAVSAPPDVKIAPPKGNRRGSFASTPDGRRGAPGTAGAGGENTNAKGSGSGGKTSGSLPPGLYVGKPSDASASVAGDPRNSSAYSVNPKLIANARVPARALQPESESKLSEEERAVFGNRRFYSLSLNMPNLNSAGGSWIIRFAALKPDSNLSISSPAKSSPANPYSEDLSAPSATRKVDPAYPLELMRQNVGGTVILYGVIHANGTVGNVRVLRSSDERLDQFAGEAVAKWHFQPATKDGTPVDVEATFSIPFRPGKINSSF